MSTRVILEIFGWIGSGLIVLSLAQARVWRFRVMNFIGAVMEKLITIPTEIISITHVSSFLPQKQ